jgi:hypothetical protein
LRDGADRSDYDAHAPRVVQLQQRREDGRAEEEDDRRSKDAGGGWSRTRERIIPENESHGQGQGVCPGAADPSAERVAQDVLFRPSLKKAPRAEREIGEAYQNET